MKRDAINVSESQLPDGSSSEGEDTGHYKSPPDSIRKDNEPDDGEYFEFEFFRLIKIKSKRVTANVIILIGMVILAILIGYLSKR